MRAVVVVLLIFFAHQMDAKELTVSPQPFVVEHHFEATVLPTECYHFELSADRWDQFIPVELAAHGSQVASGELLISFDREAFDKRIADLDHKISSAKLALEFEELSMEELSDSSQADQGDSEISDLATATKQFSNIEQKADENLTPRLGERKSALLKEQVRLRVVAARIQLERTLDEREKLMKQQVWFEWKSPIDGRFYHGPVPTPTRLKPKDHDLLEIGQNTQINQAIASVVPENSPKVLVAEVDRATALALKVNDVAAVWLQGRPGAVTRGTITEIELVPAADNPYLLQISVDWSVEEPIALLQNAKCSAISYENPAAIVLPTLALQQQLGGAWTVPIRLADGQLAARKVVTGIWTNDMVEIIEGLEAGQVVVTRD